MCQEGIEGSSLPTIAPARGWLPALASRPPHHESHGFPVPVTRVTMSLHSKHSGWVLFTWLGPGCVLLHICISAVKGVLITASLPSVPRSPVCQPGLSSFLSLGVPMVRFLVIAACLVALVLPLTPDPHQGTIPSCITALPVSPICVSHEVHLVPHRLVPTCSSVSPRPRYEAVMSLPRPLFLLCPLCCVLPSQVDLRPAAVPAALARASGMAAV